jgi:hypothetical protein
MEIGDLFVTKLSISEQMPCYPQIFENQRIIVAA